MSETVQRVYAAIMARDVAQLETALTAPDLRLNEHVDDTTPLLLAVHQTFVQVRQPTQQRMTAPRPDVVDMATSHIGCAFATRTRG